MSFWNKLGNDIDGKYANDALGKSVSLSSDGTIVAISAPNNVRVYKLNNNIWAQKCAPGDISRQCDSSI